MQGLFSSVALQDFSNQPRPQGLLLVQNGGRRNPWPRLPKWPEQFIRISSCKQYEMSSVCYNNGFRLQKTNRAGNNLRKSHFTMCHVTKYSTIRGVFQQPWPGVSPTAILNEEKALGMRLFSNSKKKCCIKFTLVHQMGRTKLCPTISTNFLK